MTEPKYLFCNEVSDSLLQMIIDLDQNFMGHPWTEKQWLETRDVGSSRFAICLFKNVIVGFALISFDPFCETAHLYKIVTNNEFRRLGFAKSLIQFIIDELIYYASRSIVLDVDSSNLAAIKLYKSLNFKELHFRKNYYSDGGDSFLFELTIGEKKT